MAFRPALLAPHPRPLPVPIHFALHNLSAGRGCRSWQVQLSPQNPSPSNPPRTVPSPRRQLVSERNRSDGERVRVRGNSSLARRFELPKAALCQHQNHLVSILAPHPRPLPVPIRVALHNLSAGRGSRSWQVQLPPQNPSPSNPPRTVPSPRRQLGSERNRSDGERVRVRGNPNHAGRFELPKAALCQHQK
jgi:hypothetical protein